MELANVIFANEEDVYRFIEDIKHGRAFGSVSITDISIVGNISIDYERINAIVNGDSGLALDVGIILGKILQSNKISELPWYKRLLRTHPIA